VIYKGFPKFRSGLDLFNISGKLPLLTALLDFVKVFL